MSDMTSAVAIDLLDNLIGMVDDNQGNDYDSALHMAIDALKAQADGDTISRQAAIDAIVDCTNCKTADELRAYVTKHTLDNGWTGGIVDALDAVEALPSAQPDTEKICARIKAEAIKRNVEYMKHGDRYMLGFVDGMRLARRIVDGTVDDPVYFTTS